MKLTGNFFWLFLICVVILTVIMGLNVICFRIDVNVSDISSTSKFRRYMPQIIAVIIKNSVLFVYGISIGLPTILIPNLSGTDPNESIVLDEEGISWIGKCIMLIIV